ncbi:MAG: hypothetical protein HQL23_00700 [Candidatus Omnitrophica bacterium]|nr:hypothetical protein [Candidatus Omnitrophota bacterium]
MKKNFRKIVIGYGLIALALFFGLAAFYVLEVKPKVAAQRKKQAAVKRQITTVTLREASNAAPADAPSGPTAGVDAPARGNLADTAVAGSENRDASELKTAADSAEPKVPLVPSPVPENTAPAPASAARENPVLDMSRYSEAERARAEGTLWHDRARNEYILTLGAAQKLSVGDRLPVYSGDQIIGEVEVTQAQDVVSKVKPVSGNLADAPGNYFKVVLPKK